MLAHANDDSGVRTGQVLAYRSMDLMEVNQNSEDTSRCSIVHDPELTFPHTYLCQIHLLESTCHDLSHQILSLQQLQSNSTGSLHSLRTIATDWWPRSIEAGELATTEKSSDRIVHKWICLCRQSVRRLVKQEVGGG